MKSLQGDSVDAYVKQRVKLPKQNLYQLAIVRQNIIQPT